MRLIPSDPDVATIAARIDRGDLDLQPSFQRGEVWSLGKKQRLIDSILREWHVPPIHVIELSDSKRQEVLDGQQRLVAIRDFMHGKFPIVGQTEPYDPQIETLDGLYYESLPPEWRRRFDQFTIRIFKITDYVAGEPGELFYRLNQPTNLTAAEQRNAFFGPARQQVKEFVDALEKGGIGRESIGFSNSRMAYDDVIARLCCSLDLGTLAEKVTASTLTEKYRSENPFSTMTMERCGAGIERLLGVTSYVVAPIKLNKATLYSWLWFFSDSTRFLGQKDDQLVGQFLSAFEDLRESENRREINIDAETSSFPVEREFSTYVMNVYNDRSSARVADVSSVLARDAVIWIMFSLFCRKVAPGVRPPMPKSEASRALTSRHTTARDAAAVLEELVQLPNWGSAL